MISVNKKTALTHHWMFRMRGGEKVLEQLCMLFPSANISCLVFGRDKLSLRINGHRITGSLLQKWSWAKRFYKELLPLHPLLIRTMKVPQETELVVASDAAMMKGIPVPEDCLLVCYCHSPPRYLWEMADTYAQQTSGLGFLAKQIFRLIIPYCKKFDLKAASRVDLFIANSNFVANRIRQCYQRDSVVVHPPVELPNFRWDQPRDKFYLMVSELVSYKRIDIAIETFNQSGLPLVIIGDGPERKSLEALAKHNIRFLGRCPSQVLQKHYETCHAFIFPGIEDFGITPLEAQAAGAPVIAFGQGGALETVQDQVTGLFFDEQTPASLNDAIEKLKLLYQTQGDQLARHCRRNAEAFGPERFRAETLKAIQSLIESKNSKEQAA